MTYMPKAYGTGKDGGDIGQGNYGAQGNLSAQALEGVANVGLAALGSRAGFAVAEQYGSQSVTQHSSQSNSGYAGDGGSDNVHGETYIRA